jgi:phosphonate transport system permease protein
MSAEAGRERPAPPPFRELPWHQRLDFAGITFLLLIAGAVVSAGTLRGPGRDIDYVANLRRFLGRLFPPDFSVWREVLAALGETVQIALVATALAIVAALPVAVAAARNLSPRPVVILIRMVLNAVRTIPSLVWAVLAVVIAGPSAVAGVIALAFYSLGYLGKFLSEAFESADIEAARALRATGASRAQAFQYGLWPSVKPLAWSYSLWMLEYNIRSAVIIGYVGAGGIGMKLHAFQEFGQWEKFSTVLLVLLVIVTALDLLGESIRRRMTKKLHVAEKAA